MDGSSSSNKSQPPDFEPKHRRLPSVEQSTTDRENLLHSQISPPSQESLYADQSPTTSKHGGQNSSGDLRPVPVASASEPIAFERRGPRYQSGKYASYEEMLAAMEENQDPFNNPPPPSRGRHHRGRDDDDDDDLPDRFKPTPHEPPAPQGLTKRERSKIYDEEKRKKKKKRRAPQQPSGGLVEGVDNHGYVSSSAGGGGGGGGRRESLKSNGTYTLDKDNKELLEMESPAHARPSSVEMSLGAGMLSIEDSQLQQTARSMEYGYMTRRDAPEVCQCFSHHQLYFFP